MKLLCHFWLHRWRRVDSGSCYHVARKCERCGKFRQELCIF